MKEIFRFKGVDDLYCDKQGFFFYKGKPTKKIYNNGSISVLCGKSKKGLIKLRKLAYVSQMDNDVIPF